MSKNLDGTVVAITGGSRGRLATGAVPRPRHAVPPIAGRSKSNSRDRVVCFHPDANYQGVVSLPLQGVAGVPEISRPRRLRNPTSLYGTVQISSLPVRDRCVPG